jgi:hypothetical protein
MKHHPSKFHISLCRYLNSIVNPQRGVGGQHQYFSAASKAASPGNPTDVAIHFFTTIITSLPHFARLVVVHQYSFDRYSSTQF